MRGWEARFKERQIELQVYDGEVLTADTLIYDNRSAEAKAKALAATPGIDRLTPVDFAGRRWTSRIVQPGGLATITDYRSTWIALFGGTIITLLLFGLTLSLLTTRAAAQRMAERLTQELQANEASYRNHFVNSASAMLMLDPAEGAIIEANTAATRFYGYPREQLLTLRVSDLNTAPAAEVRQAMAVVLQGLTNRFESQHRMADGSLREVEVSTGPIDFAGRTLLHSIIQDVTERKRAEEALRTAQAFGLAILNSLVAEIVVLDHHGVILAVNEPWERFALENSREPGQPVPHTAVGDNYLAVLQPGPEQTPGAAQAAQASLGIQAVMAGELPRFSLEYPGHSPTQERWFSLTVSPLRQGPGTASGGGVVISHVDITALKRVEVLLRDALAEKTTLLKEIHHRVKNNLQIVASLLSLQAGQVHNQDVLDLLSVTQNRVRAMALLHESLYQSKNMARLDLLNYVRSLCEHLLRATGFSGGRIRLEPQVESDKIALGLEQAVPCGLLINELVTNALKHAFPGDRHGRIQVKLEGPTPHTVRLTVVDDGIGLPATLEPDRVESLGLRLVSMLTKQLHGTVTFERGLGTAIQIHFPSPAKTEPPNE